MPHTRWLSESSINKRTNDHIQSLLPFSALLRLFLSVSSSSAFASRFSSLLSVSLLASTLSSCVSLLTILSSPLSRFRSRFFPFGLLTQAYSALSRLIPLIELFNCHRTLPTLVGPSSNKPSRLGAQDRRSGFAS